MGPRVRTALVVAVVSMLIWLYAEAELQRTEEFPSVTVRFDAPAAGARAVWLAEGTGDTIRAAVSVQGNTASLERVRDVLSREVVLTPGRELPAAPGEHQVPLKDALRRHEGLAGVPITILEATPPVVRLRVAEVVSVTLPVEVVMPESVALSGPAEPDPGEARLLVPAPLWQTPPARARLEAPIDPQRLAAASPNQRLRLPEVRLLPPPEVRGRPGVRVEPAAVAVSLVVRGATDEYVKASVPVHVRLPDFLMEEWRVTIPEQDRNLRDVRVSGPTELVDLIRTDKVALIAYVPLTFEDLERRITSKEAVFADLPIGVAAGQLRIEAADRMISLEIRPREPFVGPVPPPGEGE